MKAAQLRQSILQTAVQGKLVPQNIHDEPASELLERIRQEKAQLVKEGKIKKEKSLLPIAEDETPRDLPDGWVFIGLESVINKITDRKKQINQKQIRHTGKYPVVSQSAILIEGFCDDTTKVLHIDKPVIVFGDHSLTLKLVDFDFVIGADGTQIFEPVLLDAKYLYYVLLNNIIQIPNNSYSRHYKYLKEIPVPLPPLAEQQRIVARVDELMALCDELEAAEKELDALESCFAEYLPKSILQAAVQGKLVPQNVHDESATELLKRIQQEKARLVKEGKIKKEKPLPPIAADEIPYHLPNGWVWCRIKDVCLVNPRNQLSDETSVAFIPMTLISSDYFGGHNQETREWAKVKSGFTHFAENDIAVAKITPCFQNGKSCIMRNLKNGFGAGTTELHILRCLEILPEYALIFVKSPQFLLDGEHNMTGTAGQQRVPTEFILNYLFPLPPLAEQQRIVTKVDELMVLCDELKAAKDISVKRASSNIMPFPQQSEDKLEIGIAARGEVQGLSDAAARDIKELFGDDCNG